MRYRFSLNSKIKGYIEWQLEHYHEDKKQLEQYRASLMPSGTHKYSPTAGVKTGVSTPTEDIAIRLATDPYILTTERNINAITRVLEKCDDTDIKLIELYYWKQTHTLVGAAGKAGLTKSPAYERINRIICMTALEMGLVNI